MAILWLFIPRLPSEYTNLNADNNSKHNLSLISFTSLVCYYWTAATGVYRMGLYEVFSRYTLLKLTWSRDIFLFLWPCCLCVMHLLFRLNTLNKSTPNKNSNPINPYECPKEKLRDHTMWINHISYSNTHIHRFPPHTDIHTVHTCYQ